MTTWIASVPTAHGSRYLQQLCKHWSHKFALDFTTDSGTVNLPFGKLVMTAHAEALDVRIELTDPQEAERAKDVVTRHLDRFAFREAPLPFEWRAG